MSENSRDDILVTRDMSPDQLGGKPLRALHRAWVGQPSWLREHGTYHPEAFTRPSNRAVVRRQQRLDKRARAKTLVKGYRHLDLLLEQRS